MQESPNDSTWPSRPALPYCGLGDVGGASYMYDYDFVRQIDKSELDRLPLPSDVDSVLHKAAISRSSLAKTTQPPSRDMMHGAGFSSILGP